MRTGEYGGFGLLGLLGRPGLVGLLGLVGVVLLLGVAVGGPRRPLVTRGSRSRATPDPPRAAPASADPLPAVPVAVLADLVASLLDAGLPIPTALAVVDRCLPGAGLSAPADLGVLVEALTLAEQTGLAPSGLVRSAVAEQQRRRAAEQSAAARRLAVLVVLPMGLCLLPAFVLLTVVPLALALLR